MAVIKCKDRQVFVDSMLWLYQNTDEWSSFVKLVMNGVGIDDVEDQEDGSVLIFVDYMSFDDFIQMLPDEFHENFTEVIKEEEVAEC